MTITHSDHSALVEHIAAVLYCDTFTQYGPLTETKQRRWNKTSEPQREFCRGQSAAAIKEIFDLFKIKVA